jgi:hypothetical protein
MIEIESGITVHWYYRIEGKVHGPVLISRLRQIAHAGKLTSDDLVRKGKTGEWVVAKNYPEIGAGTAAIPVTPTSMKSSAPKSFTDVPDRKWLTEVSESAYDRIMDFVSGVRWAIVSRLDLLRKILGYFTLSVVTICLLGLVCGEMRWRASGTVSPYEDCVAIWNELKLHREAKANDVTWNEFVTRANEKLTPVVEQLARDASAANRSSQLLLWAARDCLRPMLSDSRQAPSRSELELADYLGNVERLRKGELIYGGSRIARIEQSRQSNPLLETLKDDPMMAALSVVVTIANIVIVVYLVRGLWAARGAARGAATE